VELTNFIPVNGLWLYAFIILAALLLVQLFYYVYFFFKFIRHTKKTNSNKSGTYPPVSVIICAKNESKNLEVNLPKVFNQDYPGIFEVIVVNDASEDDTELILAQFKKNHKQLYYTSIPYDKKFRHGKKLALTIGIKAAKHEHLVFTDADCYPQSDQWLKQMIQGFNENKEIVLGFGPYENQKGLINKWLRYDTLYIAAQYFSYALRGIPYMGVGRNMAYKKELFSKTNGFKSHQHILSGDDDLFIRDAATKNNVAIVWEESATTVSKPASSFKEWKRQKSRHLTTSPQYKFKIKMLLSIEALSRQLFWVLSFVSIFFSTFVVTGLLILILKLIIQLSALHLICKRLNQKNLYWYGIIFDFMLPLVTGFLLLGAKRQAKKNKWT